MQKENTEQQITRQKMLYTMLLLLFYMVGKTVPLYGVNHSAYVGNRIDAQRLLTQTISGDIQQISLFALGISPYMIVMLAVQIINSLRKLNTEAKISVKKTNQAVMAFTVALAFFQAVLNVRNLIFAEYVKFVFAAQCIAVLEMITGAVLIVWMAERNARYGIGGQTAFIFINILEGILKMLLECDPGELMLPLLLSLTAMIVIVLMENAEIRIPMQRISIYNIYADKNYLAFKMNPIGVMPVMFSTAFFMLPQLLISGLDWMIPGNCCIEWWKANMILSAPLGITVYIGILYVLTIGFSLIFISPDDLAEQFLKSGDSIVNIHAGKDTRRYLGKTIFGIGIFSATVMGIFIGVPLFLYMKGLISPELSMLPASVMMLTGICCNLFREMKTIRIHDSYKVFL